MPELPEVETTVNGLKREVLNRTFLDFWTDTPKIVRGYEVEEFKSRIKDKTIIEIKRRAKNILLLLNSGYYLLIHLKMTGHLLIGRWVYSSLEDKNVSLVDGPIRDDSYNRFIRAIFYLDDGRQLALCDMRKFAKIELLTKREVQEISDALGPEPLQDLSLDGFVFLFSNKKGKIKQVLMDQAFIAGIGNIYASEILFESQIHPETDASKLNNVELELLYESMKKVLKRAIKEGGDSFSDFRNIYGERGGFQNIMKVYAKDGHVCEKCDSFIIRSKLGGRGTFYCPNCQKIKE